jgi:type III pantothenate kinase
MSQRSPSLLLDIGNTSIHGGVADVELEHTFRTTEDKLDAIEEAWEEGSPGTSPDQILLASVNPGAEEAVRSYLERIWDASIHRFGTEIPVPIDVHISSPEEVGDDRLLNATAVWHRYNTAAIAVDCGTAVTFDIITSDGAFHGGVIAPGISISAKALHDHTAMLPEIDPGPTGDAFGQDTKTAIQTGIYHGFTGMVRRILKQIKQDLDDEPLVIGLGGDIRLFDQPDQLFDKIDRELTLKGLLDAWTIANQES